ncbi:glycosyltransferase [Saprospira grandis DSM 2844]|uniref:Glycosyltransferase n=1 Tax=Saprospira grandis DSM 2844 TaxID=694433 RepID=J0P0X4_9BACT|nr:glycosyltransferase family 1 protein [Saprospira grandis]EJF53449.1 glycosyltransferase [Saprospira grandis DSM 2844]
MSIAINARFLLANKLEGIGWYSYEILKRWVEQHPEEEFVFFFDRPYAPQFVFGPNVRPVVLGPPARHPILFYLWFEWSLPAAFKKYGCDRFFSPDGFLSLRAKIPTLLVIHDIAWRHFPDLVPWAHRKHYEYFMPKFIAAAQKIATVSDYSKQDILAQFPAAQGKTFYSYNGCHQSYQPLEDLEQKAVRQQYADGQDYFLYLGSIHPRKNMLRLLQAFEDFKAKSNSPILLLVAGRLAWQNDELKSYLDQMQYRSSVRLLGYLPQEELPKVLGAAYALLYLSLFEGFGLPLLEAAAAGVPSLGANSSSMPEVVGAAGLLADPYSVADISDQMQRLVQDKALYDSLKAATAQQASHFSWQQAAEELWTELMALKV